MVAVVLHYPQKSYQRYPLVTVENRNCNVNNQTSAVNNLGEGRANRWCRRNQQRRRRRRSIRGGDPFLNAGNGQLVDYFLDENRPETCSALGLECRTCVQRSAASVAHICHGLQPEAIAGMFPQIYSSPGCAHMAEAFAASYYEACAPIRKPVLVAMSATAAFVAA